ncbi:MAG: tetratricopeptide repeat protein, partial [Gemmatimonadetes bacterium]|nr:tetratricopeptide repeat protein [Gemmatimonadota bacterium]
ARLARTLRGDLDTIVLQALQKDPSRRYASAEAFADDIARYLDGLPVRARPDSWTYRTGKFVRRNRGMVLSGLSLLLTIAFFTVGSVVQAIQLQRERDVARRERDRAQAVADFLSEVFGASAPENALGTEPTARELLDRGAERIRADERMDPELKASLSAVIGNVYQGMGLEQQALPLFEEALATQRATRPDPDVEQVETAVNLGYSLMQLGDFDRAIPTFEQAVAWAEALPEATPRLRINAERALGIAFTRNGRYAEARVRLEEALARARAEGDTVLELSAANDVGQLEMDSGNWAEAAEIHQRVLNRREATLDPLHPNVLTSLNNLAIALEQTTRFAEAAVAYDTLLARSGRLYGPESGTHATYLNNAASFFKRAGQPERALPLQEQALDIYTVSHGDSSAYVAMAYNNLANILHDLGQTRDAAALHRRALALNLALYGEVHFRTAGSYNNLAAALRDLGDLDGAIENYRRTLDIDRRASGEDHPFTATDRVNLASALSAHGVWSEAEAQFDSAAALQDRVLEPMNTDRALRLVEEGIHAMRRGDPEVAVPLLREALRIDEAGLPPTSTQVAYARTALGAALVRTGQREEGVELLRSGYARLREAAGPQSRGALQAAAWLREAGADPR